jgi:hypothetical protein
MIVSLLNKQTVISHYYHQQTNNHLSPLTSTNKQSSLTITINKQAIISHHYHQQTIVCLLMIMVTDDWLIVNGNSKR